MTQQTGWSCPKCSRVWAPHVAACGACNARQTLPFDQVPRAPYIGTPNWNFTADDMSYRHQGGDPA